MLAEFLSRKAPTLPVIGLIFLHITLLPWVVYCTSPQCGNWPLNYGNDALQPGGLSNFDFVVISGGWSGSILARRLSENPDWRILVLERGTANYSTEPTTENCLGKINSLCKFSRYIDGSESVPYVRADPTDYGNWLNEGNYGWDWDGVSVYLNKTVQKRAYSPDDFRSYPTEYLNVNEAKSLSRNLNDVLTFLRNSRKRIAYIQDFARSVAVQESIPTVSMKSSKEIGGRPNLYIIKNVEVRHIKFNPDNTRATGVTFLVRNSQELEVKVKKEVVLSAGTIESAKILMLSGIGVTDHLDRIPVLKDLPVGQNLQGHPTLPLFLTMNVLDVEPLQEEKGNEDETASTNGELPLTEMYASIHNLTEADIEYKYFYLKRNSMADLRNWWKSLDLADFYHHCLQKELTAKNLLIVNLVLTQPKSKGSVKLRSANYTEAPEIITNCVKRKEDVDAMLRGIRLMQVRVITNPRSQNIAFWKIPNPRCYEYAEDSDDYWRCYIRTFVTSTYDLAGTVKMGSTAADSCVDPRLLVHGVNNLRIADASIIPKIPKGDITAATVMIAEKAADLIKKDWVYSESELFSDKMIINN